MEPNKEIISKLKFIGRVRKGEKINVQHMYVQPCGFATTVSRSIINQDNRANTLNFVHSTIINAFELLDGYKNSHSDSSKVMTDHIIKDLNSAKNGLESLKETYKGDVKFCCDMDTLLQIIDSKLIDDSS
jgi:hypothetical protein